MSAQSQSLSYIIGFKGLANIAVAVTLLTRPELVYLSPIAQRLHSYTGLRISDAKLAPSLHHASALLALSVGIGQLYASRSTDVNVLSAFVLMNGFWAVSTLLTCLLKPEIASSTILFAGAQDLLVTALSFAVAGPALMQCYGIVAKEGKTPSDKDL